MGIWMFGRLTRRLRLTSVSAISTMLPCVLSAVVTPWGTARAALSKDGTTPAALPGGGNWGEIRKILQQTPSRRPAIAVPLWKLWRKSVQTVRYQQQRTRMNPVTLGNQNQTNKSPSSRALCTTRKRAKHSISMSTPRPWVASAPHSRNAMIPTISSRTPRWRSTPGGLNRQHQMGCTWAESSSRGNWWTKR